MNNDRVRMVDIAEELGVSTATVSNVIHGKTKKVSPETVKRVQELLEKRSYIPSMAGILLAQNDSKIVGVVVNDHEKYEGHTLEDGFISASLNELSKELDREGYFMMVKLTTDADEIPRFASMWNMVGIVIIGFCLHDYQKLRDKMHIPFIIYDGFLECGTGLVNLTLDNYGGGKMMGEYLKELGHEKVLCIADNDTCMDRDRYLGLKSVYPQCELMVVPMSLGERRDFYEKNIERILKHTAVFAVSDYYAADLMKFLRSKGIKIPESVTVTGFDDSILSRQFEPSITTIGQNHSKRAHLALELFLKLRAGELTECNHLLPVSLIKRESSAERIVQTL